MKLLISKNQSKGLIGGINFEVKAIVQLTPEERKLVETHRLANEVLMSKKLVNIWGQPTDRELKVSVSNMVAGETYKCKSLLEVMAFSQSLKEACDVLKSYLVLAHSFGGEEVLEF